MNTHYTAKSIYGGIFRRANGELVKLDSLCMANRAEGIEYREKSRGFNFGNRLVLAEISPLESRHLDEVPIVPVFARFLQTEDGPLPVFEAEV